LRELNMSFAIISSYNPSYNASLMSALREFWFPLLLAAVGIIPGIVPLISEGYAAGNGRRVMFTLMGVLFLAALLSYIWGDPVRGPFAYLTSPQMPESFLFHAGRTCPFPVKQLKDGINFSNCMKIPGDPIELRLQKTWWSGLRVEVTGKGSGAAGFTFKNDKLEHSEGIDVNHDDYAFEVVSLAKVPSFQIIISKNYAEIYVNALVELGDRAVFMKDATLAIIPAEALRSPQFRLDRIFKYPSYAHQGERE